MCRRCVNPHALSWAAVGTRTHTGVNHNDQETCNSLIQEAKFAIDLSEDPSGVEEIFEVEGPHFWYITLLACVPVDEIDVV